MPSDSEGWTINAVYFAEACDMGLLTTRIIWPKVLREARAPAVPHHHASNSNDVDMNETRKPIWIGTLQPQRNRCALR